MERVLVNLLLVRREIVSSESESSSDDEWDTVLKERGTRQLRPRIMNYTGLVDRYLDHEFKSHFRISRATFEFVLQTIGQDLVRRKLEGCPTIPAREQLMIALWKMATIDSYRSVCDRFNVGRATALRAVRRVTDALFRKSQVFIQWPSHDRAMTIIHGFEECSGFPKTMGAIDGTHIRIDAPKENSADYVNRKGFHSIQLQVVCDQRTLIMHCYAGYPGSVHDQRVFRHSEVADFLNDANKFPLDSFLLGDAAYELHDRLLTPFKDNGHLNDRQRNYNYRHSSARVVVERCIGLLKGRMRSLLHCLPMRRLDLMAKYIIACCVIHNICTLRGDEIAVIAIPPHAEDNARNQNVQGHALAQQHTGILKRNIIMNNLIID